MSGKLIIIESGSDASGKATQTKKLYERLLKDGYNVRKFLDVPVNFSKKLMENRKNKFTGEKKKDIHESDIKYLEKSYENSLYIADKYNWNKINCVENDKLRSIDSIHEEIYNLVIDRIKSMER